MPQEFEDQNKTEPASTSVDESELDGGEIGEDNLDDSEVEDEQESVARYRLSILEMGEAFGVSEACRRHGIQHRQTYYGWKKKYAADGLEGLKDIVRERKTHPFKVDEETESFIESYALQYPTEGAEALKDRLEEEEDICLSHVTIQRILKSKGLGRQAQRLAAYQNWQQRFGPATQPLRRYDDSKLAVALRHANPALQHSVDQNSQPGSCLFQFGFLRRSIERGGSVYVQVLVDSNSSMAWVEIHARKKRDYAESFLRRIYAAYLEQGVQIRAVVTDNGSEFCFDYKPNWRYLKDLFEGIKHPYEHLLRVRGIGHGKILAHRYMHADREPRDPNTIYEEVVGRDILVHKANGIVERFYNTLRREFFDPVLRESPHIPLGELQKELAIWLKGYNETFSHLHEGYPNFGQTPMSRLELYLKEREQNRK